MKAATMKPVHVIGGGLAGSDAAWQLARAGVPVVLHEMRPERGTDAHQTDGLAELVCSNSFRSDDSESNAVGLLHEEMRRAGSLIIAAADKHRAEADSANAVLQSHLKDLGIGVRRDGYIVGVSFAIEDGPAFYLPVRHESREDNLDPEKVFGYLGAQAAGFRRSPNGCPPRQAS